MKMKKSELKERFCTSGWDVYSQRGGELVLAKVSGERVLLALPKCQEFGEYIHTDLRLMCSSRRFLQAMDMVLGERESLGVLFLGSSRDSIHKTNNLSPEICRAMLESALKWCERQDIQEKILEISQQENSLPGDAALKKISALAVLKREEILGELLQKMQRGESVGFPPYVTVEYVARGLQFASAS